MAGCCGSDGRSRAGKLLWGGVWLGIAVLVAGLWVWERRPHHHHGDAGPHGGPLADWGDGAFHLEVVAGRDDETVTVYALDRWAKKPKPIDAKSLTLTLRTDPETVVQVAPVPDAGDPAGRSTRFAARHPVFRAEARLSGTITGTAGGKTYSGDFSQK